MNRSILLSLLLSAPAAAQLAPAAATSAKAVQRLNRAPVSKEILKVRLPRPTFATLPNGLTVMVVEQHKLPTVQMALWVTQSGPVTEPGRLPGLAKFTADMLREGTKTRSSAQLALDVDELGASLEASAAWGTDLSIVSASGLVEDSGRLLELMSDMATHPTFSAGELEKYKKRELAQLEELRANPQFLGRERFYAALYGEASPARVGPTAEAIKSVTSEDLKQYHADRYVPANSILGIAGDITLKEALPLVQKRFGGWTGKKAAAPALPAIPKAGGTRVLLVDRPGSVQTEIVAGNYSLVRTSPDYIPLTVANRVLGGGPSARLFLQLREEKGYTYGAYSNFSADIYPGAFSARLAVRNEVTEPAMKDLLAELKKIRDEKVPADELDDSRRSIVAKFALSLESPGTLLNLWMSARYYGLPEDYWDRYTEEVALTSPDKVQDAAKKYVDTDHLQIVCVGDAKKIQPLLTQFGPVEVYDVDGKRVEPAK